MKKSWRSYAEKTFAIEKKFLPLLVRAIQGFRSSFINDLTSKGLNTARNELSLQMMDESLSKLLTRMYKEAGLTGAKLQHALLPTIEQKAGSLGKNEQWIRDVQDYLNEHLLGFVQNITDTMREDILKVLEKAIEEGWGIDRIVAELKSQRLVQSRARVIARTEINRAANAGHAIAAQQLPYEVNKKWIAAKDHRTRHSHRLTNGHVVDEDGAFRVPIYKGDKPTGEYDLMQIPGDPNASASNTINCRCRVIYEPKRDAQGRLILRRANTAQIIPMRNLRNKIPAAQIAAELKANIRIGVDVTE